MSVLPMLKVVILGDSGVGKTCLRSQFVNHIFSNAYKATIGSDYLTTTVEIPQKQPQLHSLQLQNAPHQPNSTHSDSIQGHTPNLAVDSRQGGPKLGSLPDKLKKGSKLQNSNSTLKDNSLLLEQETTIPHNRNDIPPSLLGNTLTKVNLQIWDTSGQERFNSISQAFYRGADVVVLVYDITNYESVLSLRDWFARFMNHCHVDKPGVIIVGNKIDKANERVVDMEEIRHIITSNTDINVNDYIDNWEEDLVEVNAKSSPLVEKLFTRVAVIGVGLSNSKTAVQHLNTLDLSQTTRTSYCAC